MLSKRLSNFTDFIIKIVSSKKFLIFVVGLFVLQASWIAASNRFPMIIDEGTHLATIRYYSEHLSPFLSDQSSNVDAAGIVARNLSVLYYFLLGIVYHLLEYLPKFSPVQTTILLRLLHVAFFAGGLVYIYKCLRLLGLGRGVSNTSILLFTLLPITPFLAAHINYDNLLFLVGAAHIYFAIKIISSRRQPDSLNVLVKFMLTGLTASLIKFSFIPIFLASLGVLTYTNFWRNRMKIFSLLRKKEQWTIFTIVGASLFVTLIAIGAERYLGNYARFSTFMPSCPVALSEQRCEVDALYQRDKLLENANKDTPRISYTAYMTLWLNNMHDGLYFLAVKPPSNAKAFDPRTASDSVIVPDPPAFLRTATWVLSIIGGGLVLFAFHKIKNKKPIIFVLAISSVYIAFLFLSNHATYLKLGQPIAVQGRYLILLLPFMFGLVIYAAGTIIKNTQMKALLFVALVFAFSQGGGAISYIVKSDARWYWSNNSLVIKANQKARNILNDIVVFD